MKNIARDLIEGYFYIAICLTTYFILIHFHVRPYYPQGNFGFWIMLVVWTMTFYGGDFLIKRLERHILIKKAIKTIKKLGYKEVDIEKIEIFHEKDADIADVTLKEDKEEKE